MKKLLLQAILFLAALSETKATDHKITVIDKFTVENGLPNNFINKILRDSRGFLWLSTRNNISRYDGKNFKVYSGSTSSISGSATDMVEDREGNIWFSSTVDGVIELKATRNNYEVINWSKQLGIKQLTGFIFDNKGFVWISTAFDGLFVLDPKSKKVIHPDTSPFTLKHVLTVSLDSFSNIIVGTHTGIYKISCGANFVSDGVCKTSLLAVFWVIKIFIPTKNDVWVFSYDSVIIFKKNYSEIVKISLNLFSFASFTENHIYAVSLIPGSTNEFLIAGTDGIFVYNYSNKWYFPAFRDVENRTLRRFVSNCIYWQGNGILWIGSQDGLYRARFDDVIFKSLYIPELEDGPSVLKLRCIQETGSDTFLAGINNKGLKLMKLSNNSLETIRSFTPDADDKNALTSTTINVIFKDSKNRIWVGLNNYYIQRADDKTMKFKRYHLGGYVWSICETKDGIIWAGTTSGTGLVAIDPETDKISSYDLKDKNSNLAYDLRIFHILEIDNILWLSTNLGLYRFDIKKRRFLFNLPDLSKISNEHVWSTLKYDDSLIFISTESGLRKLNIQTGRLNFIPSEISIFYHAARDINGDIWLVTDRGLAKYNVKTGCFHFYGKKDGLITNNFSFVGSCTRKNGDLVFCGEYGFNILHDTPVKDQKEVFHVNISSLKIFERQYMDILKNRDTVNLNFDQNFVAFDFAGSGLDIDQKNRYSYYLEGLDNQWHFVSNIQSAVYTGLKDGIYTFKVRAANADGIWKEAPTILTLIIRPPYWRTWWFYLLSGGGLLFACSGLVVANVRNLKRKHAKDRLVIESEIKALRSQMNPHFIFNSLNAVQHFILINKKRDANLYLSRFANLIREILDNTSKQYITIKDETDFLSNYLELESLRLEKRLAWRIDIHDEVGLMVKIPSLILQPLVENAIVHGISPKIAGGNITITFSREENMIKCVVADDGMGLSAPTTRMTGTRTHESKGLDLIKRRLVFINKQYKTNARLIMQSGPQEDGEYITGTRVILYLPDINP